MAPTAEAVILASASPARAVMLTAAGLDFRIEPAAIDEDAVRRSARTAGMPAVDCALRLAELKAAAVCARHPGTLVIGADQILVVGDMWFDKPTDLAGARRQLETLRGRTHELATAVCVRCDGDRLWQAQSRARLTMRDFSDRFLDTYLAAEGEALLGSVGAYRLEARGIQLFSRIDGDQFAILGLPLVELLGFLRECGVLGS